ncbi:MAG TPA: DUF4349 domain-containing protein [Candidatus Baltobacteraceae bacterium]|nr:DUF4349 domain-containing protein [Candidatus Baltobacteraceae bacterium]
MNTRSTVAAIAAVVIVLLGISLAASKMPRGEYTATPTADTYMPVEKALIVNARARNGAFQPAAPAPAAHSTLRLTAPQIERTGRISLYVGDVEAAVRRLSQLARRQSGDVFSLTVSNEDRRSAASAQMDLRVPSAVFDATMDGVAAAGKVRERSVSAQDVTGDITDSAARLRNLQQTERDIRAIMDRSGNVSQVMDAENQLSQVREQIEELESSLAAMRGQVAYSTISVDVQAEAAAQPVEPNALAQIANAWHAALHALAQTAIAIAALLVWLLVLAPLFAVAALIVLIVSAQLRNRAARAAAVERP